MINYEIVAEKKKVKYGKNLEPSVFNSWENRERNRHTIDIDGG